MVFECGHVREMNQIENMFYSAFLNMMPISEGFPFTIFELEPQVNIGIYVVDFLYGECVVEIDGHEAHKTKEQREKDYTKTRYLMKKGYHVVRFMGTEVFLDAKKCVMEMIEIADIIESREREIWFKGQELGVKKVSESYG